MWDPGKNPKILSKDLKGAPAVSVRQTNLEINPKIILEHLS